MSSPLNEEVQALLDRLAGETRTAKQLVAEAIRSLACADRELADQVRAEVSRQSPRLSSFQEEVLHRIRSVPFNGPGSGSTCSVTLLRMAGDIRRIGALAENLASGMIADPSPELRDHLDRMAAPVWPHAVRRAAQSLYGRSDLVA